MSDGPAAPRCDAVEEPAGELPPPTGVRILLADDDPVLRKVQADFLRRFGYAVLSAGDGDEALRILATDPVDLVVTDMVMPGADGVTLIRHIREAYPRMRIIAISGGGGSARRELLLDIARVLGVCRTLEKPFMMTGLVKVVREVLAEPFPQ